MIALLDWGPLWTLVLALALLVLAVLFFRREARLYGRAQQLAPGRASGVDAVTSAAQGDVFVKHAPRLPNSPGGEPFMPPCRDCGLFVCACDAIEREERYAYE